MKYEIKIINEDNIFAMLPISIDYPILEGSEEQIEWANDMLCKLKNHFSKRNSQHILRLPKGINTDDTRMESALDAHTSRIQAKYNAFFANKKAAFYIDKLKRINEQSDIEVIQAIITA